MVHDLEQEKLEMANTLDDLRSQLQSKTLETTFQNFHESVGQKETLAIASDTETKATYMEDLEKSIGLFEERLQISQTDGEHLKMSGNQYPLDF